MNPDFSAFERCRLLVVGDLMLDEYVWGRVERISPEAPVPVVTVLNEEFTLGGAANVARNLSLLDARVAVAGVVGAGPQGSRLRSELTKLGVEIGAVIEEPGRPTTLKTRIIAEHQQVLRVDRETTRAISKDSEQALMSRALERVSDVDVILISDYGKGAVSRALIESLSEKARAAGKLTIADPKGLDFSKYAGLTLITPNKKEAALAAGMDVKDEAGLLAAGQRLLETVAIDKLLITCGKDGMVFFERGEAPLKIGTGPPGVRRIRRRGHRGGGAGTGAGRGPLLSGRHQNGQRRCGRRRGQGRHRRRVAR
jgi:rfaE bifunctional protein kinase chain/domain